MCAEVCGNRAAEFERLFWNEGFGFVMFLYFKEKEKENDEKHWLLKVAMLQTDLIGGMLFGKDYKVSLAKEVDKNFDDDEIATSGSYLTRNEQDEMEQKLRAIGIKIKEV